MSPGKVCMVGWNRLFRKSANYNLQKVRLLLEREACRVDLVYMYILRSELGTFEWWISGLMLDPLFFLISRLNNDSFWSFQLWLISTFPIPLYFFEAKLNKILRKIEAFYFVSIITCIIKELWRSTTMFWISININNQINLFISYLSVK